MKAMVLNQVGRLSENPYPLVLEDLPDPVPSGREILVRISVCGVCHTELDEIEGRTPPPRFPVIPGHQVVGRVASLGCKAGRFTVGDRVGIAWIHSACGKCDHCRSGYENLCPAFRATGRDVNGGYAQYLTVPEDFAFSLPDKISDAEAAPLLCAGAIGFRSLKLSGLKDGQNLGLTGFGASGHLMLKLVKHQFPKTKVFVFARNAAERAFSMELGAVWAGKAADHSPEKLDAAVDTTPAWEPVVEALKNLRPGGRLVINAIRKEETDKACLMQLDYPAHLWMEKEIKSVANVSRSDVSQFLTAAEQMGIRPRTTEFALSRANEALAALKSGDIRGAKILRIP